MKKCWPENIQSAVALTFDVDAETLWLSRNPESEKFPGLIAEGTYGAKVGVPRILRMLKRLDLKATFFVPCWVLEKHIDIIQQVVADGHEVGYHGYLHEVPDTIEEERQLILRCKTIMQDLLSITPKGYRAPEWETRPGMADLLIETGFEYSSNFMDSDHPYLHCPDLPEPIVELPPSWILDDSANFFFTFQDPQRVRTIPSPDMIEKLWFAEFSGIHEEGGCMTLTMHPQIIGRSSRVQMLEDLLIKIRRHPGVLIAGGLEIARQAKLALKS
jgi:peptidoglycan-N-acetylglucosamine deacetylase